MATPAAFDIDNAAAEACLLVDANGVPLVTSGGLVSRPKDLTPITVTGAAGAAATLTIPAPGAGVFNYLVYLQVILYATAAMAGAAAPILVPITGIPNGWTLTFPTALAIGQTAEQKFEGVGAIKASAANGTIVVSAPIATGGLWRINAAYFVAA